MHDDRWPQEDAGQAAYEAEVGEIQRNDGAVDRRAEQRWPWPASDSKPRWGMISLVLGNATAYAISSGNGMTAAARLTNAFIDTIGQMK